jgi:hypothetical protein
VPRLIFGGPSKSRPPIFPLSIFDFRNLWPNFDRARKNPFGSELLIYVLLDQTLRSEFSIGRACHGYEYFFSIIKVTFCGLLVKI